MPRSVVDARLRLRDAPFLARLVRDLWAFERRKRSASLPDLVAPFSARSAGARLDVERAVWLTTGVLRRLYAQRFCLPRALVLFRALGGAGLPARLVVGVRRTLGGALDGHAWVELAGEPVGEPVDPRALFAPTFVHPPLSFTEMPHDPTLALSGS